MNRPMSLHQTLTWSRAFSEAMTSYFELNTIRKLQLGSGTNVLAGWFNTDVTPRDNVYFLDSSKPFPFKDAVFHYIFSEHHIEHLTYNHGLFTLRECYRVLLPGGKIRIATPSLEMLLNLYTASPDEFQQRYIHFILDNFLPRIQNANPVFIINNAFRNWGHQFLYDRVTLQQAMEDVGFVDISHTVPGESDDEQLYALEKHGVFIEDEEMNRFETQVLEGRRP